jgi:hypothetical protein
MEYALSEWKSKRFLEACGNDKALAAPNIEEYLRLPRDNLDISNILQRLDDDEDGRPVVRFDVMEFVALSDPFPMHIAMMLNIESMVEEAHAPSLGHDFLWNIGSMSTMIFWKRAHLWYKLFSMNERLFPGLLNRMIISDASATSKRIIDMICRYALDATTSSKIIIHENTHASEKGLVSVEDS